MRSRSSTNSSRKSRRRLLCEREYRANSAPFTTSGRLTSANTGRSRLVKYGRRTAASSSVKFSGGYTPTVSPPTCPEDPSGLAMVSARPRTDGDRSPEFSDDDQECLRDAPRPAPAWPWARPRRRSRARPVGRSRRPAHHVDPASGRLGDAGVREVDALREPGADPGPLAARHRVHLHLGPAVAGVAPRDEVEAPQVLPAGHHDRGGGTVVDHPPVDLDPQLGRGGRASRPDRVRCRPPPC